MNISLITLRCTCFNQHLNEILLDNDAFNEINAHSAGRNDDSTEKDSNIPKKNSFTLVHLKKFMVIAIGTFTVVGVPEN